MRAKMSLHETWVLRMPGRSCRSRRLGGATRSAPHVARDDRLERHCRRCMSHCTRTRGDTFALECRPSRARRATCKLWHVAPRADPERHARPGMSHRTSVKRDMDRVAASPVPSSKATFTLLLVVPRAWVGRHAAATSATSTRETVAWHRSFGSQLAASVRPDSATTGCVGLRGRTPSLRVHQRDLRRLPSTMRRRRCGWRYRRVRCVPWGAASVRSAGPAVVRNPLDRQARSRRSSGAVSARVSASRRPLRRRLANFPGSAPVGARAGHAVRFGGLPRNSNGAGPSRR
jgi:hypothetical protein